ncbi:unnamed protein product [Pocillopora meandrina]|uniref:Uncharacterized protein n=1 Tax=Pocillopora meandrina TaxID=46732 RepID=A0AAU9XSQ9_9CNID|nr:unnamed protein product [Pocillopora meandrina]
MNSDLLECKRKAKDLISSVDPPRNATGRKKGYIEVMADLWEDKVNESSSGLLDLSPDVLRGLHDKHPEAADIAEESLLHGPVDYIPPNVYDLIDEEMIHSSASKTKARQGHQEWTRNFIGESCALTTLRLRIAVFTRNLPKKSYHPCLLKAFTSCGLIPLDKNPGIRPIGVGDVLRRIVGKTVSGLLRRK